MSSISDNVKRILAELPEGVQLEAAAKTRTASEIKEAIEAGVKIIGENYLQEAEKVFPEIGRIVRWHYIGSLQRRKIKKIVRIFDMIETVSSMEFADEINKRAGQLNKIMPVLIEVNSGKEPQKSGVMPEDCENLVRRISTLPNIKIEGLMTMGPLVDDPEKLRPYFKLTKELFDRIKELELPNVEMKYLSMGMSSSYKVAISEGANLVRIGTLIFGPRKK
ncbi:MAG: YggS family pyridoxal phosphate-dependent enzyme [Caldisericaceae bacterium]|nr:YggS family pyridoxal phosphate-dependent enzyme [Caldisericaceae bacterium]